MNRSGRPIRRAMKLPLKKQICEDNLMILKLFLKKKWRTGSWLKRNWRMQRRSWRITKRKLQKLKLEFRQMKTILQDQHLEYQNDLEQSVRQFKYLMDQELTESFPVGSEGATSLLACNKSHLSDLLGKKDIF